MKAPLVSLSRLGERGLFRDGDWVESKDQDASGTVRLTQLADVGVGTFRNRSDRWMREDQADRLGCTFLQPADILVARMPEPLGRACLAPEGIGRAVTAVDVAILRVDHSAVSPAYVMWMINAPQFNAEVVARQSGTTRKRISRKNLAALAVPLPDLAEQQRIVEILEDHLSHLDAAADYASAVERRLASLRRSTLEELFGRSSKRVPLKQLVDHIEAGKSLGGAAAAARDQEWGIIKVSAMTWGKFLPEENKAIPADRADPRYEIHAGDLLVSRANTSEYVGASVLVDDPGRPRLLLSDKSLRVVPTADTNPAWLWRALQSPTSRAQISALATGTKDSMRNISQKSLLRVHVPDVGTEEQEAAVQQFTEAEQKWGILESELSRSRARAQSLRRAVLAAAFSGKLTGRHTDDEVVEEIAG
ncbi:restriction endonuclease subunit S [Flexivirga sp. ID2601S]|uniref:Restriction endonuclease subunit S n=1 Tax=Flexivirga aerilata TaxID=1656889 RepID=A0A849AI09_9MICO|nr:restriction endonuclease subunit S [Flexivirga aerilata]